MITVLSCRARTSIALVFFTQLFLTSIAAAQPAAPNGIDGNVSGTNANVSWNKVDGADGYNIYIDNSYITTTFNSEYSFELAAGSSVNVHVTAFSKNPSLFSPRSTQITLPQSAVPTDLTIPPSVPSDLTGTINGGSVSLTWTSSTDDEAVAGYNVYQNNQYITTVFDTRYDGSVTPGQTYTYGVSAFDTRVNFSSISPAITLPQSTQPVQPSDTTIPPSTPTGLAGTFNDGNQSSVSLSWNASTDDQAVKGYNVYENGNYKSTVFATQYSTNVESDTRNSYYVVAFDFDGNFAPRTSSISLSSSSTQTSEQQSIDTEIPDAPQNLLGTWTPNGSTAEVTLQWSAATDNVGIAGYNVYENQNYLTTVQNNSFTTTVNADQTYTYQVVAFDQARNFSRRSDAETLPNSGNQIPFFVDLRDRTHFAGEDINIVIRPDDNDGSVPGLFIGTLPTGMRSVDNFNGTRSIIWSPLQPDVGEYEIELTAFDADDLTVRVMDSFTLTIALPEDLSTIRNVPPGIDGVSEQIARVGDTVIQWVKATDGNGTFPNLEILNPPANSSFDPVPDEPLLREFRWVPSESNLGLNTFEFFASDAVDPNLTINSSIDFNIASQDSFSRAGERLKTLAENKDKLIGYASVLNFHLRADSDLYKDIAAEEFNMVTAENSMKWSFINPEPGRYRFDAADTLVEFVNENGMTLHGHTLVWYSALPQWVQTSEVSDRETIMNEFIDTMTSRYNSVDVWDVVNEAFEDDGTFRNSVWFQAMGEGHVEKAFRRAQSGAPNAELIYNDYDIAAGGPKTDATFALMQDLISNDVPIDGIGFQMHIDADFTDFTAVRNTFSRFANLGLDIYITELDVSQVSGTDEEDQANVYENVANVCLEQSACKALQTWGFTDRHTWLRGDTPLLLDRDYQPKPAYRALQRAFGG